MNLNEIKLERVEVESKEQLENLMSLYLHDLSEFAPDLKVNENGKFHYDGLELYFKSEDLNPFFILYKGEVAGFVLFNSGKYVTKDIDYVIHELFLLKAFRKKGIANAAVETLLNTYKGTYKIVQISSNNKAVHFWTRFYEKHGIKYEQSKERLDDIDCNVQVFKV